MGKSLKRRKAVMANMDLLMNQACGLFSLSMTNVLNFSDGSAAVKLNDKWGTIDIANNVIIPISHFRIKK